MLRQRKYQLSLGLDHLNWLISRQFLTLKGMDAAYKCAQTHLTNLLSVEFHICHLKQYNIFINFVQLGKD